MAARHDSITDWRYEKFLEVGRRRRGANMSGRQQCDMSKDSHSPRLVLAKAAGKAAGKDQESVSSAPCRMVA